MRSRPAGIDERDVADALTRGWDLDARDLEYAPKGAGSYHWVATAGEGQYFVTVDDLGSKPWLGTDRATTFAALRDAFDIALALREQHDLEFVVAPLRTLDGTSLHPVTDRYSVALFPFVDGEAGLFADVRAPAVRDAVLAILAELHAAPVAELPAGRRGVDLAGREHLKAALRDVDDPWGPTPLAEEARTALEPRADDVREWLAIFDRLTATVAARANPVVLTHGEPHGGNFLRAGDHLMLIDWDTVGLAVPERDLWMLDDGTPDALRAYTERTGRTIDTDAIDLYRLTWTLADLAAYGAVLRSSAEGTADVQKALSAFTSYL